MKSKRLPIAPSAHMETTLSDIHLSISSPDVKSDIGVAHVI